ncbi:MAG: hypothetical protein ACR2OH_09265 [Microthrixaceae bacterium]
MTDKPAEMNDTDSDPPEDEPSTDSPDKGLGGLPRWLVPLLIGLVTITAGLFSWRAGQLASSAAFEDRQSVGQTIKQETLNVQAGLQTVNDAVGYVSYRADFAEATALDGVAVELAEQGLLESSEAAQREADELRETATRRAESLGVFGQQSVLEQTVIAPEEPISFNIDDQLAGNQANLSTDITSPGVLDPDKWAEMADDTRERVRLLKWDTLLLLLSVLAYTAAELAPNRQVRRAGFAVGSVLYVFVVIAAFTGSFW